MSIVRPDAAVVIDGRRLSAAEGAVAELHVELGVDGGFDRVTLTLSRLSPVLDVRLDATVTVAMGDRDSLVDVFTGRVVAAWARPDGAVVEALADAVALADVRVGRAYLDQTAGDIARDLIASAGLRAGSIDAALDLPAYHVDERRTAWRHLRDLGRLCDAVVRSGADGSVDFVQHRARRADHRLRAGAELIAWQIGETGARRSMDVVPSSAASEAGASRWQFLLAEPDGGAPGEPTVVVAPARTRDGARTMADAIAAAADRRGTGGWLMVTGSPAIRAGDLVEVAELPHGGERTWRVLDAQHRLDSLGLRSRFRVEAAA